jgi:penicillin-binding protein 1C
MKRFLAVVLFSMLVASDAAALPVFQEVKDSYRASDAVLLDRHGIVIHELRVDPTARRLDWTGIRDISPSLIKAVIHSEDKRFYSHYGVDWIAAGSAAVHTLFGKTPRGASTITMQLASLLDEQLQPVGRQRTLGQKWRQMKAAQELEKTWSKDEILEAYLNILTFRGELQGIAAAARGIFGKEASGLNEPESLILASLIRAPNASPERTGVRACLLGDSLRSPVGCEEIKNLAGRSLAYPYSIIQEIALAPHVARQVLKMGERPGTAEDALFSLPGTDGQSTKKSRPAVVSTLDTGIQRFASETLRQHILSVKDRNVRDGAVLVAENKTGNILAYVGSIGAGSSAPHVDGVKARRQAGSTLKPFLYASALEQQVLTPASLLSDSPVDVPTALGIYRPENYENDFKGMVSVRTALASSLNIPAVRVLSLIGTDALEGKLGQLGFQGIKDDDYYGLSLALGSADVSLYELVNAYRTFANTGLWGPLQLIPADSRETRRAFSEEAAFLVSEILSDREARSYTFSLENPLSTKYWSAVKTGTSKDMRDNWCIGYSSEYTVGVWVGNFSGAAMWNVSGVTGAAPVWLDIMNYLHKDDKGVLPHPPKNVYAKTIYFQNGVEPPRNEWFVRDTGPIGGEEIQGVVSINAAHAIIRITYPADGMIISLDPDIPEENQYIFFETIASSSGHVWTLNGERIPGALPDAVRWKPVRGRYVLSLVDREDHVIDTVHFEVRGAEPRTAGTFL